MSTGVIAPAINRAVFLRQELFKAYGAAGVNLVKTVQASIRLNMSLTKTKIALEAIYKSVGARFFGLLTKQSDIFRDKLYKNMPKIQNALERFVFFVFKAFDATVQLGERVWSILTRVYDFFYMLHKATDGWSTLVLAAVAAWKFLNLSFLATPLGMLLTLGLTLLGLYDDLKTFVEGGQSVINWGSDTTKMIVGLIAALGGVVAIFYVGKAAIAAFNGVAAVLEGVLAVISGELDLIAIAMAIIEAPIWLIVGAIAALVAALTLADSKWKIFGGNLASFFSGLGGKILSFIASGPFNNGVQQLNSFFQQPSPVSNNTQIRVRTRKYTRKRTSRFRVQPTRKARVDMWPVSKRTSTATWPGTFRPR